MENRQFMMADDGKLSFDDGKLYKNANFGAG